MVAIRYTGDELWARIERAVEKVKIRLERVTKALDAAGIPYAVVGGNAVQVWVAQIDEAAIRNTRSVDIILNRSSLPAAIANHSDSYIDIRRAWTCSSMDLTQKHGMLCKWYLQGSSFVQTKRNQFPRSINREW